MKRICLLLILVLIAGEMAAQHKALSTTTSEARFRAHQMLGQSEAEKEAIEFARKNNLPVREIDANGRIKEIRRVVNGRHPEYLTTHNITSASTISTEALWDGTVDGIDLNGEGMVAAVWDAGKVLTSHVEFDSRALNFDVGSGLVGHATHVAGTIGASGVSSEAHGMANEIRIESYNWNNDNNEMRIAAENGLLLSNHSYGSVSGFDYNFTAQRWEWFGDPEISRTEDYTFGIYSFDSQAWDHISYNNPYYLIVKSAGNDRLQGPTTDPVHFIWDNGWEQSSVRRDLDGGPDGYDCIGSTGTAKNILTVGAVRDIADGYQNPEDVVMTSFSCFGPTDDGRIKPDIVANGQGLYSTYHNSDTDYERLSGTSMSAPSVTGSMALLQQLYNIKFQQYLRSATLKALVLHTADDAGNPGPDYQFGWGLMNTRKAAEIIAASKTSEVTIREDSLSTDQVMEFYVYMDGSEKGRATICWTDPAGKRPKASLDPKDTILVNDLDIRITKRADQGIFYPYILDPEVPGKAATTGDNFRDNIEMIDIPAEEGFYKLSISHKDEIKDTIQRFSLIMEGMFEVYLSPDADTLTTNNGEFHLTSAPVYPSNSSFSWLIDPENEQSIDLTFSSFETDPEDMLSIYDGPDNTANLLGVFSGTLADLDTTVTSSGPSMFIEFISVDDSNSKGFKINYCTTIPESVGSIMGEDKPCIGNTEKYFITPLTGINYSWDISDPSIDTSILSSSSIELSAIDRNLQLAIIPMNSCGTGAETILQIRPVQSAPALSGSIEGDTLPCIDAQNYYSVKYDSDARYEWIIPENWTSSNDSSGIWLTPQDESGIIMLVPYNSCGSDDTLSLGLSAAKLPTDAIIITDNSSPCQNSIQEFSVTPSEGINYQWKADQNWEILGSDTSYSARLNIDEAISGRLTLISSNKCGEKPVTREYSFAPQPDQPVVTVKESSIKGYNQLLLENYDLFTDISWLFENSLLTSDQESVLIQRNGRYSVVVTNSAGCTRTLELEEQVVINDEALLFSIYNGSVPGEFLVINDTQEEAVLEGFSLMGKAIFNVDLSPGENYFSSPDRSSFILKITGPGYSKSQIIILP